MKKILKWLYVKNRLTRLIYMIITTFIRQPFYIFIGNKHKSLQIITEHFNW